MANESLNTLVILPSIYLCHKWSICIYHCSQNHLQAGTTHVTTCSPLCNKDSFCLFIDTIVVAHVRGLFTLPQIFSGQKRDMQSSVLISASMI